MIKENTIPRLYAEDYGASAGSPYRPGNGSEGDAFIAHWCSNCSKFEKTEEQEACPIFGATLFLDVDDPDYPKEWHWHECGQPVCAAFAKDIEGQEPGYRCEQTPDPFAGYMEASA